MLKLTLPLVMVMVPVTQETNLLENMGGLLKLLVSDLLDRRRGFQPEDADLVPLRSEYSLARPLLVVCPARPEYSLALPLLVVCLGLLSISTDAILCEPAFLSQQLATSWQQSRTALSRRAN